MASPAQSDVFDVLDVVAAFYKIAPMDKAPQALAERPLSVTYRPLGSLVPSPQYGTIAPMYLLLQRYLSFWMRDTF